MHFILNYVKNTALSEANAAVKSGINCFPPALAFMNLLLDLQLAFRGRAELLRAHNSQKVNVY